MSVPFVFLAVRPGFDLMVVLVVVITLISCRFLFSLFFPVVVLFVFPLVQHHRLKKTGSLTRNKVVAGVNNAYSKR